MGTKGLRNAAIFTFLFSMAILLVGGHFARDKVPPIPGQVVSQGTTISVAVGGEATDRPGHRTRKVYTGDMSRCPFGPDKPTCAKCPIHCYKPQVRERVREVMRFAGPRMLLRHPVLAVRQPS